MRDIVRSGFAGVGFFFILSGFILAYTYLGRTRRRRTGPRTFTTIASLLLVQAWIPCSARVLNQPGWSLSAEVFFYLRLPFIAPGVARLGRRGVFGSEQQYSTQAFR